VGGLARFTHADTSRWRARFQPDPAHVVLVAVVLNASSAERIDAL
jgi:hypothetical protein